MSELLKEHPPISNWLIASPVPRVKDWACHWPGKSLRCDAADRRKRLKVAGTTLLRVLLALVAAVTWCTTRGHSAPPGKIRNRSGCREIRIKFWDVEDGGTLLGDRSIEELKNPDNQRRTEEHRLLLASFRIRKDFVRACSKILPPHQRSSGPVAES